MREYAFQLNGIDPAQADLTKFNRRIVPFLEELGYPWLDLYPQIEQRPAGEPLLYHTGHDDHFNNAGHQFAGEAIAHWIAERF